MTPSPPDELAARVRLRAVTDADLDVFFTHQQDAAAVHMAAFTSEDPSDRVAFDAHWARIRNLDSIVTRTILFDGTVAGHMASFVREGDQEVTYWLGSEFWGRGIATRALERFLAEVKLRPLHGRVAKDNVASRRVLEKCGFVPCGEERGFANARGEVIEEVVLRLDAEGE